MYTYMYIYICVSLLYFGHKYDCFSLANISQTSAIKLIFALKMEKSKNPRFSNFEGNNQIT